MSVENSAMTHHTNQDEKGEVYKLGQKDTLQETKSNLEEVHMAHNLEAHPDK